jgi:2',3'-cyclic-nucleotide 2'-phosphodiesterase (5'-nucleotidase family)
MHKLTFLIFLALGTFLAGCSQEPTQLKPGESMSIMVMATSDLHGWLHPWDYARDTTDQRYGLAKLATLIDSVRGVHNNTFLLDAGDWLQGNAYADYYAKERPDSPGYPLLQIGELLQYDAMVVGNHEFNFGMELLDRRIAQTTIPVLGANAYRAGTQDPYFHPWIMREIRGINVAVVGLTTPGSAVWDRPRVEGILDFADGVEVAQRYITEVRELGAQIVIVLAHTGLERGSSYNIESVAEENFGRRLAETIPGVDLLIIGHSHRVVEGITVKGPDGREVAVVQPGRWGSHLGLAEIVVTMQSDQKLDIQTLPTKALSVQTVVPRQDIITMTELSHEEVRAFINQTIATTTSTWETQRSRLQDTPAIDLIHEIQLAVTGAQLSAASVFNTNTTLSPGPITRRDLVQLYPYENMLYTMEITGGQLRSYLEHTFRYYDGVQDGEPVINRSVAGFNFDSIAGVEYTIDLRRPVGQRLVRLLYNDRPVRPADTFTIAVNSYRAEGGGGFEMLTGAPVVWKSDVPVRTYMEQYLSDRQTITSEEVFVPNWQVIW